ncbi:hypothetical protein MVEN_01328000 [Mycena venus]|uniref:Uncharacterized protein n=1 Tax=Mycena venus TaxID=2733690 RepID=A0A8H7CU16_9AGAR|nr:hypothetical protein MVEN_01328000 [Mycena venus]
MPPAKDKGKGKQVPTAPRLATRSSNEKKRPAFDTGFRAPWRTKRTSEQKKADDDKAESDKLEAERQQKKLTERVAELEDNMRQQDLERAAHANHPKDAAVPSARGNAKSGAQEEEVEPAEEEEGVAPQDEFELDSQDEYEDDPEADEDESDKDDNEDDRGRSRKFKLSRKDVEAAQSTKSQSGTPKVDGEPDKRKNPPTADKKVVKKAKKSKKSGLAKRTASSASGKSSLMAVDSDEDDSMVRYGGPAVDDDANEHVELKSKKRGRPVQSDTVKVTIPPKPPTLKDLHEGRDKWTVQDLPANATRIFNDHVIPLARALKGVDLDPWEPLTNFQLQGIIDMVYIQDGHDVEKHGLIPDVKKEPVWHGLVGYRLNDWRGNIGRQALKGIEAMIAEARAEPEPEPEPEPEAPEPEGDNTEDQVDADNEAPVEEGEDEFPDEYFDLKTPESVAAYIEWALRAEGHTAPFHWRRWGQGKKKKEGLFETALIAYAYVSHLVALRAVPSCYVPAPDPKPPIAALILCIQAVERALRAWSTGNLVISSTTKRDHFSKDNWADTSKTVDGKDMKDRRATKYVHTLLDFTPEQWAAIEDRASQWMPKKRAGSSRGSSMDASGMDELPSDEDDYFVLKADA